MEKRKAASLNIKVPWGHIAAKAWGNEQNIKVLLVHGILDNAGSFDRLIAQLPRNFYYVCIDLPGHGLSSHFPSGIMLDYFCFIFAIRCVLDSLQWKQTNIIGHSLGAHLSLMFSVIYPERIQKLILIEGVVPRSLTSYDQIIPSLRDLQDLAIKANDLKSHRYYTKEEVLYALTKTRKCCLSSEAANAIFDRSVTKVGDDSYYYNRDFRARHSIRPIFSKEQNYFLLRQIKAETLLILATDTIQPIREVKSEWCDILKNYNYVNIVEVKGNHDVHNNHPERVAGHISTFLNNISSKL